MKGHVIIGSRGSRLALIQSESVASKLKELNPGLEVNIKKIETKGDRDHRTQFDRFRGVGIFVKELEDALLAGKIDLAVHSLKDMPTELPPGLSLEAVMERADPRDILVSRIGKKLAELPAGSKIGTGSLRRAVQVTACRPDLTVGGIRGNVDTRLEKVSRGEFDGVILAAAGMLRMDWQDRITEYLSVEQFLPAVGQGALAVETRSDDKEIVRFVSGVNHLPSWQSVTAERAFLLALGGGCRAPIAALGTVSGATLKLEGMVADVSRTRILRAVEVGKAVDAGAVGNRLAQKILAMGAAEFIDKVRQDEAG